MKIYRKIVSSLFRSKSSRIDNCIQGYDFDEEDEAEVLMSILIECGLLKASDIRYYGWSKGFRKSLLSKLNRMVELRLRHCTSFQLTRTLASLPNLKSLYITAISISPDPASVLLTNSTLETLTVQYSPVASGNDLARFLLEILAIFSNLSELRLNNIETSHLQSSCRAISQTIKSIEEYNDPSITIPTSRLRVLELGRCQYSSDEAMLPKEEIEPDPLEVEALKTILLAFPELQVIDEQLWNNETMQTHELSADIYYLLEINYAGRVLVEGNPKTPDDNTNIKTAATVPLSIWPQVLARAWKRHHATTRIRDSYASSADGIYYLLRNTPALQERSSTQRFESTIPTQDLRTESTICCETHQHSKKETPFLNKHTSTPRKEQALMQG